jgi:YggT family protein
LNALSFLVESFSRLYLLCFLLRLMLQVARADFYHPLAQFIVAITNPLVVPARRLLPSFRRFDLPTLIVLFVLQLAVVVLLLALRGIVPGIQVVLALTVYQLCSLTIWTYIICILVWIILGWVQSPYSPMAIFLGQIVDPVLRPARRLLPPVGGFDVSPLIVTILLTAVLIALGDVLAIFVRPGNGLY